MVIPNRQRRDAIREMIRHENELINNRLTWLCQIQGFLFAALAVTWKYPETEYVRSIFCLAGIFVSISSYYGINAATKAIDKLYKIGNGEKSTYDPIIGLKIDPSDPSEKMLPWNSLPVIFESIWILIITYILSS
jgi:hypothetical protein